MMLPLLLSLALSANAQVVSDDPAVHVIADFKGGLNTYQSPLLIAENEAQVLNNFLLDKSGSLDRRKGYTKLNATAIGLDSSGGNSTTDVNAIYRFERSNGNKYCVAFSSTTGYYSTDGCATFTAFVSTLTRNNDVNCDAMSDNLYCVNNQYNFYFQGTASINVPSAPANLQYISVHRNRCFAAGSSSNLSRLYYSALLDCTSWTTSTDYIDIAPNDGDVITGIGPSLYDMKVVYKKFSTWVLKGVDANTFQLVNISREIGAKNQRSIQNLFNVQLFDSVGPNGGQPGIYGFDGITIKEMSKKLRNDLDLDDTLRTVTDRNVIDTKADFDAGTFDPAAMSSLRSPGIMQSSYTSRTDNTGLLWSQGTLVQVSTQEIVGQMTLARGTWSVTNGNFNTGDTTGWTVSSPANDYVIGTNGANDCAGDSGTNDIENSATCTSITGSAARTYTFSVQDTNGNDIKSCNIVTLCPIVSGGPGISCTLTSTTCDYTNVAVGAADGGKYVINTAGLTQPTTRIKFITTNDIGSYSIVSSYALTASSAVIYLNEVFKCQSSGTQRYFFAINGCGTANYMASGNYTSAIFDTAISTPIWDVFSAVMSSNSTATETFQVQASTSGNGDLYETLTSQSNGAKIAAKPRRYLKYVASLATTNLAQTSTMTSAFVGAASTGTWQSPELFLSKNMLGNGWGLFQTVQTVTGAQASISYSIKTSTYIGGTKFAPWVSLTAGSAVTASTGAYAVIIGTWTVGIGSETALTDTMILNWNEGAQTKSPASGVFQNRYHYGAQSSGGSYNDTMYVMDISGAWVKWTGVRPRSLAVVNQNLLMGDSTTTTAGFLYQLYNGDSDNGTAINAVYQSKDLSFKNIWAVKSVDSIFLVGSNTPATLTLNLLANTGLTSGNYSVNLSTGAGYKTAYVAIEPPLNGNVFSLKISNNVVTSPWTLHGFGLEMSHQGYMQP